MRHVWNWRSGFATGRSAWQLVAVAVLTVSLAVAGQALLKGSADKGKAVFDKNGCIGCHSIRGTGGKIGPDLAGVGSRHKPDWIAKQIEDPKSHNPKSVMPSFAHLPKKDREDLVAYLLTLKPAAKSR